MSAPTELVEKWRKRGGRREDEQFMDPEEWFAHKYADELESALAATSAVGTSLRARALAIGEAAHASITQPRDATDEDTTAPVWVDAETHDELVGRLTWRDEEGGFHEYSKAAADFLARLRVVPEVPNG
jgi:hypothetical protein